MVSRTKIFALPVLCFCLRSAFAGPQEVEGAVIGTGADSCASYINATSTNKVLAMEYGTWAQGWLSGTNTALHATGQPLVSLPDSHAVDLYLQQYCLGHPLDNFDLAVAHLFLEARSRRITGHQP